MDERYDPKSIEPKWQARWVKDEVFLAGARPDAPRKYVLEMLPYPSGAMHMGHVRNYLIGDVYARYYRMRGFDVLHPMGWDALGLPAENAAIKDGIHPAIRTRQNIDSFRREMQSLGYSYDWTREIATSDPSFYRWNQWFFLRLWERDMVYRRFSRVNWCPSCLTVIANEQVKDGRCERCDSVVVEREMPEWAFRITRNSQDLLDGLDQLTGWPERILAMQRNWIGRSEGVECDFALEDRSGAIRVFTTRIDTVYGCTYVILAPEHPLVAEIATAPARAEVSAFVERMASTPKLNRTADAETKEGVFTGAHALHPFTGARLPIWIANFVVADYGTGAVMAVPGHDERDFAFARAYRLPILEVIRPADGGEVPPVSAEGAAFVEDGVLVNSGPYTGLRSAEARDRMAGELERRGIGTRKVTYRQKDWGFSRQRYWGTPIPIVYCERCDPERRGTPVPDDQLPVLLPEIDTEKVLTGKGEPPLAKVPSFLHTTCPRCGGPATREVETMDTFVDSTWYYARYLSPAFDTAPFDARLAHRWLPVDIYVGGPEHAVMHLLYFRFWSRWMKVLGLVPTDEPVTRLITQGIVNGADGRKMSKRWGNVVTPDSIVSRFGADTVRTYVLFAGPPERDFDWSADQVEGAHRFLKRLWVLARAHHRHAGVRHDGPWEGRALEIRRAAHRCVRRVGEAIERLSFNTAIAGVMECLNVLTAAGEVETIAERAAMAEALRLLARVLTPFAPHIADEIAEAYGATRCTVSEPWPDYDPALVAEEVLTYAVQVNGKLRGEVQVPASAEEAEVRRAAEAEERVRQHLAGGALRRVVFVRGRLINYVVG
ncbi:MAG TPA: leucine--tRNA ligase [Myxococcaceae bacterium]|nr:leucine--tRNA ligase [Myxococcaceae bacterium]